MIGELEVYDSSTGRDVFVGTLFSMLRRGVLSTTFVYDLMRSIHNCRSPFHPFTFPDYPEHCETLCLIGGEDTLLSESLGCRMWAKAPSESLMISIILQVCLILRARDRFV